MVNNKKKKNKPRLGRNWNWARIRCNRGENDYAATSRPKFLQKRDRVWFDEGERQFSLRFN